MSYRELEEYTKLAFAEGREWVPGTQKIITLIKRGQAGVYNPATGTADRSPDTVYTLEGGILGGTEFEEMRDGVMVSVKAAVYSMPSEYLPDDLGGLPTDASLRTTMCAKGSEWAGTLPEGTACAIASVIVNGPVVKFVLRL